MNPAGHAVIDASRCGLSIAVESEYSSATRALLSDMSIQPVRVAAKQAEWGRLMDTHHYLGINGLFGGGLRHDGETRDRRRLALVGWCSGAFKVKALDAWISWAPEQQFRRLRRLIANNTYVLILPRGADRQLGLSNARLVGGHGSPTWAPFIAHLLCPCDTLPSRKKATLDRGGFRMALAVQGIVCPVCCC